MNRLIFLGTGTSQGVPIIGCHCEVCRSEDQKDKRLRASLYIEYAGRKILIDAGPDFRQQLLREGIEDLDAILLTHEHIDHTGGLDDIRAINYCKQKPVPIYCEERVLMAFKKEFYYVFEKDKYPGIPEFDIRVIYNEPFLMDGIEVVPIRAYHHRLPVLGYRIGNIAYITDASNIPEQEFTKLKELDILIISTIRREKHISHFSLEEAIKVVSKAGAKESLFTHLSHQIGTHNDLARSIPAGIEPAYDRLILTF